MKCLAPCPACNRHVATDEAVCPFCSVALPDSIPCQPRRRPQGRLSRAARLAAGAALIAAEASCGHAVYGAPVPDAGADADAEAGTAQAPAEQAPPEQGAAPPARKGD